MDRLRVKLKKEGFVINQEMSKRVKGILLQHSSSITVSVVTTTQMERIAKRCKRVPKPWASDFRRR